MAQINFRVKEDEKELLQAVAKMRGISVSELARQAVLKEFSPLRVDLAFQMLREGKLGFKHAWKLSGLSHHEFMLEWSNRGAQEVIPNEVAEKALGTALSINLETLRRAIKKI